MSSLTEEEKKKHMICHMYSVSHSSHTNSTATTTKKSCTALTYKEEKKIFFHSSHYLVNLIWSQLAKKRSDQVFNTKLIAKCMNVDKANRPRLGSMKRRIWNMPSGQSFLLSAANLVPTFSADLTKTLFLRTQKQQRIQKIKKAWSTPWS